MAVNIAAAPVRRLAGVSLTTASADELAVFYEGALGFRRLAEERLSGPVFERSMSVDGGARRLILALGEQRIELLRFDRPGRPYPPDARSSDLVFQHFAIVVSDIDAAYRWLSTFGGWTAISRGGPRRLPPASGGVTAFKFRDPEGHPIELLAFPDGAAPPVWRAERNAGPCLGIDHTAISVSDTGRSIDFYQGFGLRTGARSLNVGAGQANLDGLRAPRVEVTALSPPQAPPHLELLCYEGRDAGPVAANNDVAATRTLLEADLACPDGVIDPDGHRLLIAAPGGTSWPVRRQQGDDQRTTRV